jgi:hypothetical protein
MNIYDIRVSNGIHFLNAIKPDWRESVSFDRLDMSDDGSCILGQLFGSYDSLAGWNLEAAPYYASLGLYVYCSGEIDPYSDMKQFEVEYAWLENAWFDVLKRA